MILNDVTYKIIADKLYDNREIFTEEDFLEDLSITSHIKKLIFRYKKHKTIKVKLVLNHIITFYNVFSPTIEVNKLLIFKLREELDILKPFLLSLGYWDSKSLKDFDIEDSDIVMDPLIIQALRKEYHDRKSV